ncbi:MAG TPA: hypothetical protein VNI84_19610 [Pyrinomonadaceae bacterium]|nr:hypothetical protein [Pyrinomonadaceae bacterium]
MTKSKYIPVGEFGYETDCDFRETDEVKKFVAQVCKAISDLKGGATYRQLNARFSNRGCWINEAVESLLMTGRIRNVGSVSITRFEASDDKGIEPCPKFTKADYSAKGIEQRSHLWQRY